MLLQMANFHSFLKLSNIPLHVCCILFIYSFVDGHLSFFHILAYGNDAAMNFGVHVYFPISFIFFGYLTRLKLLDYIQVLFLLFLRNSTLFFIVTTSTTIPINSVQGSLLSNIFYLCSF